MMISKLPSHPQRYTGNGIHPRRFDHVNFLVNDPQPEQEFWTDEMGIRHNYYITGDLGNGEQRLASWMAKTNLSHEIAVMRNKDQSGSLLHHVAYYVDTADQMMRAATILADAGVKIEWGPAAARHQRRDLPLLHRALGQPDRGLERRLPALRAGLESDPLGPGRLAARPRDVGVEHARHLPALRHRPRPPGHGPAAGMSESPGGGVVAAARALAAAGLVDAFGHVSERVGDVALITPGLPMAAIESVDQLVELPLGEIDDLPAGAPKEAWIHWAIYRARPEVDSICRGQPSSPLAVAAIADELPARCSARRRSPAPRCRSSATPAWSATAAARSNSPRCSATPRP